MCFSKKIFIKFTYGSDFLRGVIFLFHGRGRNMLVALLTRSQMPVNLPLKAIIRWISSIIRFKLQLVISTLLAERLLLAGFLFSLSSKSLASKGIAANNELSRLVRTLPFSY